MRADVLEFVVDGITYQQFWGDEVNIIAISEDKKKEMSLFLKQSTTMGENTIHTVLLVTFLKIA